jgi:hypothetical protein
VRRGGHGAPRPRPGQLKVQFGRLAGDTPDIIYARGDGIPRADAHLLHNVLASKRPCVDIAAPDILSWEPSLFDELEARGYDISTLRISIEKKHD